MTDTPDFRALCSELIEELEAWISYGDEADCADAHSVVDRARAALATPPPEPPTSQITFNAPSPPEEVIRLDSDGFHYKGQFVADAGEAHRLMMAFLKQNTKSRPAPPTDEERLADFTEWLAREMPPHTIIGDPLWWAPRIWRAALKIWGQCCAQRPIPVSERLPEPGDCAPWPGEPDATPWCWAGKHIDDGWEWAQISMLGLSANSLSWCIAGGGWSHWLPANAIPFPEVTQ